MQSFLLLTNEFYPYKGGIGRYCEAMVKQLTRSFAVTLVCPNYWGQLKSYPSRNDVSLMPLIGGKFRKSQFYLLVAQLIRINFQKYDYILVADWPVWLAVSFINKYVFFKPSIRYCLMLHGTEILAFKYGKMAKKARSFGIFKHVQHIFTNSQFTRDLLFKHFENEIKSAVTVTYLAADLKGFSGPPKRPKPRPDSFILLTVGRLDSRKGHDRVIEALSLLDETKKSRLIYRVVGNGEEKYVANLQALATKNGVTLEVAQGVPDAQLGNEFLSANSFVLAAKSMQRKVEGFGIVLLEAAGYGLPSITTRVGGIPEVVIDGTTGLVCDETAASLASAIDKALSNPELLQQLAENAQRHFATFSWRKTCELTVDTMKSYC